MMPGNATCNQITTCFHPYMLKQMFGTKVSLYTAWLANGVLHLIAFMVQQIYILKIPKFVYQLQSSFHKQTYV